MSNTELLMREVETLPPNIIDEVLDFITKVKQRETPGIPVDDDVVDLETIDREYPIDWPRIAAEAEERVANVKAGNGISEEEDRVIRQKLRAEIKARILAQDSKGTLD